MTSISEQQLYLALKFGEPISPALGTVVERELLQYNYFSDVARIASGFLFRAMDGWYLDRD
jgi:hypothetical protein